MHHGYGLDTKDGDGRATNTYINIMIVNSIRFIISSGSNHSGVSNGVWIGVKLYLSCLVCVIFMDVFEQLLCKGQINVGNKHGMYFQMGGEVNYKTNIGQHIAKDQWVQLGTWYCHKLLER